MRVREVIILFTIVLCIFFLFIFLEVFLLFILFFLPFPPLFLFYFLFYSPFNFVSFFCPFSLSPLVLPLTIFLPLLFYLRSSLIPVAFCHSPSSLCRPLYEHLIGRICHLIFSRSRKSLLTTIHTAMGYAMIGESLLSCVTLLQALRDYFAALGAK